MRSFGGLPCAGWNGWDGMGWDDDNIQGVKLDESFPPRPISVLL